MPTRRRHGPLLALLVVAIVCSLASLAMLFAHPESRTGWRTSFNVVAIVLVFAAVTMSARGSGGRDA